jgi:hypothetical protein
MPGSFPFIPHRSTGIACSNLATVVTHSNIHIAEMWYIRVKLKLSLCLINYDPLYEDIWGSGVPPFLTLALNGGEWSASHPGGFIPREEEQSTHGIGGWVGPRTDLGNVEKRKSLAPAGNQTLAVLPVVCRISDWAIILVKENPKACTYECYNFSLMPSE